MLQFLDKKELWGYMDSKLHTELGWQIAQIHLKTWQDAAVYARIKDKKNKRIMEIGGGASRVLKQLSKNNTCYNVDKFQGADGGPSSEQIIPGVTNVSSFLGEFNKKNLKSKSFDIAFSISVVEHVPEAAGADFMEDIVRILKPGGVCYHAIDLYLTDNDNAAAQRRMDMYNKWFDHPKVEPLEEPIATKAVFSTAMATNPDLTMWQWSAVNPKLTDLRCRAQSVSLIMGFRKRT